MSENKDNILNLDDEFVKEVVLGIMPGIIYDLLLSEKLDENKLDNKNYLISMIRDFIKEGDFLSKVHIVRHHKYIDSIKSELEHDRVDTAIILTGVCIEHILNLFYQWSLMFKYKFDENEATSAVSSLKIRDKITWFFKIVAEFEFNEELLSNIILINKARNEIVHYKADARDFDEEKLGANNRINECLKSLDKNILIDTIEKLEIYLDSVKKEYDEKLKLAYEITEQII